MAKVNKRSIIIPIIIVAAVVVGIFIGTISERGKRYYDGSNINPFSLSSSGIDKLNNALMLVNNYYVDTITIDSITEIALPLILKDLDPHSVYIPAKDLAQVSETLEGEFDGIGIMFNMATDTIIVMNAIYGGPSDKAGIRSGDRIMRINDSLVAGRKLPQTDVMKMLRGKRGTKVNLSIERMNIKEPVLFTVVRDVIPVKSLDAAFMIVPMVAYIKLSAFSRTSYSETMKAIDLLKKQGADKLIFDLRGNGGGYLDQAIEIANQFLESNQTIVYTIDRNRVKETQLSNGSGKFKEMKLVLLVDEGSASSSEILAGAIQDNDRGLLIGRRTFGKGLVQRQFDFKDGSAIRLTVARYYTPTGRSIQKAYVKGDDMGYAMDILDRYKHQEFFNVDSIKFADSLKFTTPGGRVVYGGGGVMPDIFIPLDTMGITPYYTEVSGRNILYRYTIYYSDNHRTQLNKIETIDQLNAFFNADKRFLEDFVAYAAAHGVSANNSQIKQSKELIVSYLRSYIGRNTKLEDVGFYSNIYVVDKVMLRAIDELRIMK